MTGRKTPQVFHFEFSHIGGMRRDLVAGMAVFDQVVYAARKDECVQITVYLSGAAENSPCDRHRAIVEETFRWAVDFVHFDEEKFSIEATSGKSGGNLYLVTIRSL